MAFVAFPEPAELNVDFVHRTGDSKPLTFSQWSVENPHPGFGKDPNILNELGHTVYPKWIDSKREGKRVIVESAMEEAQHMEINASVPATPVPNNPWPSAK